METRAKARAKRALSNSSPLAGSEGTPPKQRKKAPEIEHGSDIPEKGASVGGRVERIGMVFIPPTPNIDIAAEVEDYISRKRTGYGAKFFGPQSRVRDLGLRYVLVF
jgi:hypothetical protein